MRYQKLLSPICIGGQIIKNRLTYPNASPHFLQGPETFPAEGYRAFTANLAKNGAAIVNVAEWAEYPQQRVGPMDMDMTHMLLRLEDHSDHQHSLSRWLLPLRRPWLRPPWKAHGEDSPGADPGSHRPDPAAYPPV
jgi:hypothetical protein